MKTCVLKSCYLVIFHENMEFIMDNGRIICISILLFDRTHPNKLSIKSQNSYFHDVNEH